MVCSKYLPTGEAGLLNLPARPLGGFSMSILCEILRINLIIVFNVISETSASACLPLAGVSQPKIYQTFDYALAKLSFDNESS